ncbi:hypothetical protein EW146_g1065 [Bondarzewia mesenterica]|uniref:Uncharacterized protein n=1 Tax=Bondarzewia mesenterica TaxID=1095465 RepID=A0A4S4M4X1_9AGAM|nr:hypothetical protein EW146_g1065 [Bondarzewia mesenterica]
MSVELRFAHAAPMGSLNRWDTAVSQEHRDIRNADGSDRRGPGGEHEEGGIAALCSPDNEALKPSSSLAPFQRVQYS